MNYQWRETFNNNSDVRLKTTMLKSSLCDYSDAYILVKRRIETTGGGNDAAARWADERKKGAIFKYCTPFINWKTKTKNTEIDNTKDFDIVIPMNWMEYSDNYSKTFGTLLQNYRDEPKDNLTDF